MVTSVALCWSKNGLRRLQTRRSQGLGQNEILDRHTSEGSEGFDLPVLFGFNCSGESVHTPKILKTTNFVTPRFFIDPEWFTAPNSPHDRTD